MNPDLVPLDAFEARVLGVLVEKEAVTPDAYPLTLNAVIAGCNQLTSREPVMQLSGAAVEAALAALADRKFVSIVHQAGARVPKYEHRLRIVHALERPQAVLLALLMLRGPQTAGELRQRAERLHAFAGAEDVERALQFMIDKFPPLVARLPRAPGTKETRYAHRLCGDEAIAHAASAATLAAGGEVVSAPPAGLAERVAELENEVTALRQELAEFKRRFE